MCGPRFTTLAAAVILTATCGLSFGQPIQIVDVTGTPWHYLDTSTDPGFGDTWKEPGFDDSAWPTGVGLFGRETNPGQYPYPFNTPVTAPGQGGGITSYYRTRFNWTGSTAGVLFEITNYIDDGMIMYLNGTEIYRFNMPDGIPNFFTTASAPNPGGEPVVEVATVPATGLVEGENVLAVEVHQQGSGSSDVVFGCSIFASQAIPPTFTIQPQSQTITQCTTVTLTAEATGLPAPTYQWYKDNIGFPILGATNATLTLTNIQFFDEGDYFVVASNDAGDAESQHAFLTFMPDFDGPFLVGAVASSDLTTVLATFNEAVDEFTAFDPFNYSIFETGNPGNVVGVASVTVTNDNVQVLLAIDPLTPMQPNTPYTLSVSAISDRCAGNPMLEASSVPIAFEIQLFTTGEAQVWRYNYDGVDLGTEWTAPTFDDSGWSNGLALFDVKRNDPRPDVNGEPVLTVLPLNNATTYPTDNIPTYYFRTHFTYPYAVNEDTRLLFRAMIDDACILYLNGVEIYRLGLPADIVIPFTAYTTDVGGRVMGTPNWEGPYELPTDNLQPGDNVLAVMLKNQAATSSDATMGIELLAVTSTFEQPPQQPVMSISFSGGQVTLSWTGTGTLEEAASVDGPWTPSANQNNPQSFAPTAPSKFYRVRQ